MTAATIETAMREAVAARVASLPMAETYPPVWFDGPAYTPNANTPYIRAAWIPNSTNRMFIGSGDPHQRLSLLQLDFMAPKSWTGKQATQVAGQIATHFAADTRMNFGEVTCRVTAAPHVAAPMAGDVFMQVPVTVGLEAWG
ncbi:phage tail terminator-like protein [Mesorhizobium sp. CN5-321]|uniref:phage tail terminator-like protein n=1 Tax=Mesorhizobium hunchu TaxID=3157708 RepID=UPI0032B84F0E